MLLAIMYHRVGEGKHTNSLETFREHFQHIKENYRVVLPGDPLPKGKLAVCLTFDDASFDFYDSIFPLLKEFDMRALLGVPVHYILETTDVPKKERLEVPYPLAMQEGFFETKAPFCTWQELNEMVQSGHVQLASHSNLHCNLTFDFVDLEREVVQSKQIIEEKTNQPVSSFIYPFGRTNANIDAFVSEHYLYSFRIGSKLNRNWGNGKRALNRVIGDRMPHPKALFSPLKLARILI